MINISELTKQLYGDYYISNGLLFCSFAKSFSVLLRKEPKTVAQMAICKNCGRRIAGKYGFYHIYTKNERASNFLNVDTSCTNPEPKEVKK